MKPGCLALLAGIFLFNCVNGQTLTIQNGTNLFISSNNTVSIDGLVLQPSADANLGGPNAITKNTTVTHPTANPYISRVYHFSNTISSFSGTITIYYQDSELNGIQENSLTLNVHDGSAWTSYNNGATRDAVNNYVATPGLPGIAVNELTLANESTPLPVHWLDIKAFAVNKNNQVDWKTTDEARIKDFQVQKSSNGIVWFNESSPVAAHNTSGVHSYTYTDHARFTPVTLYRVVETDLDGYSSYSAIASVRIAANNLIVLAPNPATSQIEINSLSSPIKSLSIFSAAGTKVYTVENTNQNALTLSVANLPKGYYIVNISVNGKTISAGFIKN